jgi:photosynthetic reaction center H subunit
MRSTNYIDLAQLTLYAFWFFFAALVYYLHQEGKREGYPLESERSEYMQQTGFPGIPDQKAYLLPHGAGTQLVPSSTRDTRAIKARAMEPWAGAPLVPTGNPMLDAVGPGSYAERANVPDLTVAGTARIVPMRVDKAYHIETRDPDPRGMPVMGADGVVAGKVTDIWVDRSEALIRYLEVEVGQRRVLLPINFAVIQKDKVPGEMPGLEWLFNIVMPSKTTSSGASGRTIKVNAIMGRHFADVPATASTDHVTRLEEDRICAYYGAGTLYASADRAEPLI